MVAKNLYQIIENLFGTKTSFKINRVTSQLGVTTAKILDNDPKRLSFVIINLSGNTVYIAPDNEVSSNRGILLVQSGGTATMIFSEDFEMCAMNWYGVAGGANSNIFVLEVLSEGT